MQIPPAPAVPRRAGRAAAAMALGAIAVAITLGVVLRLSDPLSSSVVPAEDPYNHMAFVREHLRTGELDGLYDGQALYPPGLHGFLAVAWVYTGIDLYDLVLIGPVVLGGVGILGMALLLWRTAGPVAGFVGALALAVAPEAIFRSTMMSPTALDLAVLPFFLYALLQVLAGRLGWIGVAGPMSVFLALAHPWLLAILCAAGMAFVLITVLCPWPAARAAPTSLVGLASCFAVLGVGLGIALTLPSFGSTLDLATNLVPVGLAIAAVALAPVAVLGLSRRLRGSGAWLARGPPHLAVRLVLGGAIAATLLAASFLAVRRGLPEFVDLPKMLGWPILGLAFAALVALPFIARPVANLAAGLVAATLPFVLFNPLRSEFLSHRTIIFLGLAMVILTGVLAASLVRGAAHLLHAWSARRVAGTPASSAAPRRGARPLLLAFAPALLVSVLLGGSVYAGTPDAYPGGWYRLYPECELDALRDVAGAANADPDAILITGDWQAKLVLAALTQDASRVWYHDGLFLSNETRDSLVAVMAKEGRPLVVVVDRYLRVETPGAETRFLESEPWQPAGAYCANMGVEQARVTTYRTGGAS